MAWTLYCNLAYSRHGAAYASKLLFASTCARHLCICLIGNFNTDAYRLYIYTNDVHVPQTSPLIYILHRLEPVSCMHVHSRNICFEHRSSIMNRASICKKCSRMEEHLHRSHVVWSFTQNMGLHRTWICMLGSMCTGAWLQKRLQNYQD
jgi:hypothetical protein